MTHKEDAHSFHENVNLVFSLFTARLLNNSRDILKKARKKEKKDIFFDVTLCESFI